MNSPTSTTFPPRTPLTPSQLTHGLSSALNIQTRGASHGKRPFAAALLAPDHTTVLLTSQSISHIEHAESTLARLAATHYPQEYLWQCTLYSTWEPCAMCAGTIYWAHIGRVVYAASEARLGELVGVGNPENFTMSLACRDVFARGQKDVEVVGPVGEWEDKVCVDAWDGYWRAARGMAEGTPVPGTDGTPF